MKAPFQVTPTPDSAGLTVPETNSIWARLTGMSGYVPALAALAIAVGFQYLSFAVFGRSVAGMFFVYLAAILIAAWCGYMPGVTVAILVVAGVPFLFRPDFSLNKVDPSGISILAIVSVMVSWTSASRRSAEALLRNLNTELERRVQEQTAALKHANTTLTHQIAELETLYGELVLGLCFLDRDLRFVRINEQLAAINGVPVAAHLGRTLRDILPQELADALEPVCRQVLATGEALLDCELRGQLPADTTVERDWLIACSPVRADRGAIIGLQVVVHDITERKRAQTALRQANDDLRRANMDLEQFAYSASHDLQEPLRMISIFTELLRRKYVGKLDGQADEYISHAIAGANRMETLIRDLQSYLKLTDVADGPPTLIDARAALELSLQDLSAALRQSGAQIHYDRLPMVPMQPGHLEQVFQNLIANAIKYRSKDVPRVHIYASSVGSDWLFRVEDNGIGIDPQYATRIFGVFKRLHRREEYEGTGIGLAICQRIIERYGGRIWVESALGKGATFCFTIPGSERPSSEHADPDR